MTGRFPAKELGLLQGQPPLLVHQLNIYYGLVTPVRHPNHALDGDGPLLDQRNVYRIVHFRLDERIKVSQLFLAELRRMPRPDGLLDDRNGNLLAHVPYRRQVREDLPECQFVLCEVIRQRLRGHV